jgi:F420-non-reducing hydrogenase iron-sulfur subunit
MTVKRITFLQGLIRFVGLEDRLSLVWISSAEAQKYVRAITEFTEKIRRLGPSPLRTDYGFSHKQGVPLSPPSPPGGEGKGEGAMADNQTLLH